MDENILRMSDVDALVIDVPVKRAAFNTWFNRISRIFHDYQHWALTLSDMLARSPSLQELAAVGESFFGNPVLVLDRNFCLLSKYDRRCKSRGPFTSRRRSGCCRKR